MGVDPNNINIDWSSYIAQIMLCNSCECFFTCYRTLAIAYMSRV